MLAQLRMRAVLVVAVGITWLWCLIGAITLPAYLVVTAIRALARRASHGGRPPSPPMLAPVILLVLYAAVMAACAVGLVVSVLWVRTPGSVGEAVAWGALPAWSAFVATATVIVLRRRIHAAPTARPEPQMASVSLQR